MSRPSKFSFSEYKKKTMYREMYFSFLHVLFFVGNFYCYKKKLVNYKGKSFHHN